MGLDIDVRIEEAFFSDLPNGAQFQLPELNAIYRKTGRSAYVAADGKESSLAVRPDLVAVLRVVAERPSLVGVPFYELPIGARFCWEQETPVKSNQLYKWSPHAAASVPPPSGSGGQASAAVYSPGLVHVPASRRVQIVTVMDRHLIHSEPDPFDFLPGSEADFSGQEVAQ